MKKLFTIAILSALAASLFTWFVAGQNQTKTSEVKREAKAESTYERVMRTQTLRCGYWHWPPLMAKGTEAGEFSGIFNDVMLAFEAVSGLDVQWTHEVLYSNMIYDLEQGKIDAICAGTWPSSARAKRVIFSKPIFYIPINAYVRASDDRFDFNKALINSPDVKVAVMDGEMSTEIRNVDFPNSTEVSIPQVAGTPVDLLLHVVSGKADITVTDGFGGGGFIRSNPGELREVKLAFPLRVMPNTIVFNDDDLRLKIFIDDSLDQLFNSGIIGSILEKYDESYPDTLIRVAPGYAHTPSN